MLFYLFTVKIIIDKNMKLEILKKFPLGTHIYTITHKLILIWKNTLYFWIYFLLFNLLVFISTSAYVLYGCISLLELANQ